MEAHKLSNRREYTKAPSEINGSQTKKKHAPIKTIENSRNPNKLNFTQAKCDLTIFCICPNEFVSQTI